MYCSCIISCRSVSPLCLISRSNWAALKGITSPGKIVVTLQGPPSTFDTEMELGVAIDAIWPPSNPTKETLVLCVMGFVPFDEACHHGALKPENRNYNGQRRRRRRHRHSAASTLVKPSLHATNEPLSLSLCLTLRPRTVGLLTPLPLLMLWQINHVFTAYG